MATTREYIAPNRQLAEKFKDAVAAYDIFTDGNRSGCPSKFTWISAVYDFAPDSPKDTRYALKLEGTKGMLDRADVFMRGIWMATKAIAPNDA